MNALIFKKICLSLHPQFCKSMKLYTRHMVEFRIQEVLSGGHNIDIVFGRL
jgi:hypothetical protein